MKNKNNKKRIKNKQNNNKTNKLESLIDNLESLLQKIFKCKWLYYILLFIAAFYLYYTGTIRRLTNLKVTDNKYMNYFYICSFIVLLIVFVLLICNNKFKKIAIEKKFLFFALILGSGYLFLSPVFSQSDESFHFLRAYQVSNGHFISPHDEEGHTYDVLPASLYATVWDDDDRFPEYKNYDDFFSESKIPLDINNVSRTDIRASGYIFLNYLPHALGISVGKLFNLSPYYLGFLARLFNMITCITLMYIGIKIIPVFKRTFSLLLLVPTVLAYVASMSADGLVISMSFLLIALVTKYIYEHTKLGWKNYLLLLLIVSFVSTCKVSYLPIIGILLFLPYDCFKNKKMKWIYTISLILFGMLCSASWIYITSINIINRGATDVTGLKKYLDFLYAFVNSMFYYAVSYNENIFAGNFLYQCRVTPFTFVPIAYLFILYLSSNSESKSLNLRFIQKLFVFCIILLVVTLIAYALYTANTEPGASLINGLQGRYFIPIILLIPFLFNESDKKVNVTNLFDTSVILHMFVFFSMINIFVY